MTTEFTTCHDCGDKIRRIDIAQKNPTRCKDCYERWVRRPGPASFSTDRRFCPVCGRDRYRDVDIMEHCYGCNRKIG
jgi:hypothetical protein